MLVIKMSVQKKVLDVAGRTNWGTSQETRARRSSDFEKKNPLICLLTDYGRDEAPYLVRSAIRAVRPKARIDDVTHEIPAFNVLAGAWRLARVVKTPTEAEGAIYVAVVDPGVGGERKSLIVRTNNGQYLVGPDNGLLSLAFQDSGIDCAVSIDNRELTLLHFAKSHTFEGKDVFGPVAAHLANGVGITEFGERLPPISLRRILLSSESTPTSRTGYLVDIDSFGNLRTNLENGSVGGFDSARVKIWCNGFELFDQTFDKKSVAQRNFENGPGTGISLVRSSTGCLDIIKKQGDASKELRITSGRIALTPDLRPVTEVSIERSTVTQIPISIEAKSTRREAAFPRCLGGLG